MCRHLGSKWAKGNGQRIEFWMDKWVDVKPVGAHIGCSSFFVSVESSVQARSRHFSDWVLSLRELYQESFDH